jgi:hypothetical protein
VYKVVSEGIAQPGKGGFPGIKFRKIKAGTIRISQIVDEHYARVDITGGTIQKDYIAELEFPLNCNDNKGR